jgi:hypothetical protein
MSATSPEPDPGHVEPKSPVVDAPALPQVGSANFTDADFYRYENRLAVSTRANSSPNHIAPYSTEALGRAGQLGRTGVASDPSIVKLRLICVTVDHEYRNDFEQMSKIGRAIRRRNKIFGVYNRLALLILLGNLAGLIVFLLKHGKRCYMYLSDPITASACNILVAILIRQEYIVNCGYRLCRKTPHTLPLAVRSRIAKYYEHGGVHSGAAAGGTVWLVVFLVLYTVGFARGTEKSIPVLVTSYFLALLLLAIVMFALPKFRFLNHDLFELTHRFAGWTSVALFWVDIILVIYDRTENGGSFGLLAIRTPSFWILVVITIHILLPWLRLRKMQFTPTVLSKHAMRLDFYSAYPPIAGIGLSVSPLFEWHPFATFPHASGSADEHSIIVSHSGDWTRRQIETPRTEYWVKGMPKIGLLSQAFMFRSVLVVTTGSGIGPCLSFLLTSSSCRKNTAACLIWSTPAPVTNYGTELYHAVLRADPNAIIIDTKVKRRPDLLALSYSVWKKTGVEAVFVISNRKLTRSIVEGLEEMDVPAYGPIWDS